MAGLRGDSCSCAAGTADWPNSLQSARVRAPHRFPQRVASSPNGFNVVHAATGIRELLSEFTNVHVDDLGLGLFHVHVAIEIIEERLLGIRSI